MSRTIIIHTGDRDIGKITSQAPVEAAPTVGNVYQIGSKMFEIVGVSDDGEAFQVRCIPYIEVDGVLQ